MAVTMKADPRFLAPNHVGHVDLNDIDPNILGGRVSAMVHEAGSSVQAYAIDQDDAWVVDVHWDLTGQVAPMICGKFCVRLILENLGPGGEDFEQEIPHMIETVP